MGWVGLQFWVLKNFEFGFRDYCPGCEIELVITVCVLGVGNWVEVRNLL